MKKKATPATSDTEQAAKLAALYALFNKVLTTYIATAELRDFYRKKWHALAS